MFITSNIDDKNGIHYIPRSMVYEYKKSRGFFFGTKRLTCVHPGLFNKLSPFPVDFSVCKPYEKDGHILVFGPSGAGKSSCISIPNICHSWNRPFVAVDVKGELQREYNKQLDRRKAKVFSLGDDEGHTYDPLYFIRQNGDDNMVANVMELSHSIIPLPVNIKDTFWIDSSRNILTAAILYYLLDPESSDMTFIDILGTIMSGSTIELINTIKESKSAVVKSFIRNFIGNKRLSESQMLCGIGQEITNRLSVFVTDPRVRGALTPNEHSMTWDDLENYNIFLSVPEARLDQYGGVVSMILTQLTRFLERRPEKHSGYNKLPNLLILLDEFPRLGKLEIITNAVSMLRSKNVTICLIMQSISQIELTYGKEISHIILENCSYKLLLNASDIKSQEYFSKLLGKYSAKKSNFGTSYSANMRVLGFTQETSETEEPLIHSHNLAYIQKPLLFTPEGVVIIEKAPYYKTPKYATIKPKRNSEKMYI